MSEPSLSHVNFKIYIRSRANQRNFTFVRPRLDVNFEI